MEVKYFDKWYGEKDAKWYLQQLPKTLETELSFEKSPSYFPSTPVPGRIKAFNENIKFILAVREPVKRQVLERKENVPVCL